MTWLSDDAVGRLREAAVWPALPTDRYALERVIGRGGMGTVYQARDLELDRDVAIKVSNAVSHDSDLERRLRQEARVLARLEHPGIVPVHDAGVLADGRIFYVMKLVRGDTLNARTDAFRDEADALPIFERVAETVAFAHAAGIVHRDLKPSNVMLGSFGEVLVLDWGVAKLLAVDAAHDRTPAARRPVAAGAGNGATEIGGADGSPPRSAPAVPADDATADGTRLGTPGFMPPEQRRGQVDAITPAADVYALGALLCWMLAGHPPTEEASPGPMLDDVRPKPSKRLRAIVQKCLAPRPADRYPDAAALAADLADYRAGRAVSAHRETALDRLGRWAHAYRAAILLVVTYLVLRVLFAVAAR